MKKNKLQANVPALRFPEFRESGEWERKSLGNVFVSITNGISLQQNNHKQGYKVTRIESISEKVLNVEKIGYVETKEDISSYKLNVGDILFSNINSISHIGKTALIENNIEDIYHGMNLLRLVSDKKNNFTFLHYQISSETHKRIFQGKANKAVNQASINQTALAKTPINLPNKGEQQKVADCLSSLDALITAESEQLTALKTHKTGLMQQLFPSEGETTPKLRFPEFQNDGAWVGYTLEDIGVISTGKTPNTKNTENWGGDILFITPTDISLDRKYQNNTERTVFPMKGVNVLDSGSIIYTCIASIGKMAMTTKPSITNQQINSVTVKKGFNNDFVFYYLLRKTPLRKHRLNRQLRFFVISEGDN